MRRRDDDTGAAIVEAPFAIGIIMLFAMGVLTITQVAWNHLNLANSVRDASRYASRAEWDPSAQTVTLARYRTIAEIKNFATTAGGDSGLSYSDVAVKVERNGLDVTPPASQEKTFTVQRGDEVTVTVTHLVSQGLYQTAATATNAVTSIFHVGHIFDPNGVHITASSSTFVE